MRLSGLYVRHNDDGTVDVYAITQPSGKHHRRKLYRVNEHPLGRDESAYHDLTDASRLTRADESIEREVASLLGDKVPVDYTASLPFPVKPGIKGEHAP